MAALNEAPEHLSRTPTRRLLLALNLKGVIAEGMPMPLIPSRNPMDSLRQADCTTVLESIQAMGTAVSCFRKKAFAWYVDTVRVVCKKLGLDVDHLPRYRCRLEHPIHDTQGSMVDEPRARDDRDGRSA